MEPVLLILIGVISLIVNIVLIYHFIVMCKSVRRIADKLAPEEEDDNANANNSGELSTTSRVVVIGLVLILIVLAYFFITEK